jgi:hypothetical protein
MTTRQTFQLILAIFAAVLFVIGTFVLGDFLLHDLSTDTGFALYGGGLVCLAIYFVIASWPPKGA